MIDLYSWGTPNGWKVSIALEESKFAYKLHPINLVKQENKTRSFLKLNPNGRIPVIVDRSNDDLVVFESGAILIYLAEKTGKLLPLSIDGRSRVLQWLMFQMSGVGPMFGQLGVFKHFMGAPNPAAISRFENESRRLVEIVNDQLRDRDYLCDVFSIADIALWPWIRSLEMLDISIRNFRHLEEWADRLAERPTFQRGINTPPRVSPPIVGANSSNDIVIR